MIHRLSSGLQQLYKVTVIVDNSSGRAVAAAVDHGGGLLGSPHGGGRLQRPLAADQGIGVWTKSKTNFK